jgi:formate-dependent nitrite reductase membrane component NrfD
MMLREVEIGWGWEVYVEMFAAGVAAGAFVIAMLLELYGRGRSPSARVAHLITLPLVLVATALLIYKLERPERFWHMVIQSENIPLPMLKWWSPISIGSWGLMIFSMFATISMVDALIDRGYLRLGPWRQGNTLHGGRLGIFFAIPAMLSALFVAGYSGALLSVTAVPGWEDTVFIAPFFIGVSITTGAGALLLIDVIRKLGPIDEIESISLLGVFSIAWQLILLLILAISLGSAISFFLSSARTIIAFTLATALAVAALALFYLRLDRMEQLRIGTGATLILISGFLYRYAVVMGPQHEIE